MTYPRAVTARLLDTDGTTVVAGAPLANAFGIAFQDAKNDVGSGTVSLATADAGAAELTPGRFVQILVAGTARFTFIIEGDPEYTVLAEGEEYDQIVRVQGRGWGAVFDQAIVEPSNLDLDLDTSWRVFSFASPDFPNAGAWTAADELYEYLNGTSYPSAASPYRAPVATDGKRYPAPIGYPFTTSPNTLEVDNTVDPATITKTANYADTFWIWPTGQELSVGYAFFRRTLTIAADGIYNIDVTADNYFTLFLEGVPILGEQTLVGIWKFWKSAELFLPAGSYQLGAVVQNPDWSLGANPGGFMMNVYTVDSGQLPETSVLVTDSNWVCDFDATIWPGWTPGQILSTLITEATATPPTGRGGLAAYASSSFGATTDTASNAWADAQDGSPYIPVFAADVGGTILDALNKMVEEGHIDWHVQPGSLILDAWGQGSAGTTPGVSLVAGTNLVSLERGATALYANALLVQWERGYVWVVYDGSEIPDNPGNFYPNEVAAFGSRVEDIYASQASSVEEARRRGEIELNNRIASGWPAIVAVVEPTSAADCPYEGFDLFDTITIPALGGGTENVEVLSINVTTDEDGYAIWTLELNRRWRNVVRNTYELLREIGGKSGQGYGIAE